MVSSPLPRVKTALPHMPNGLIFESPMTAYVGAP